MTKIQNRLTVILSIVIFCLFFNLSRAQTPSADEHEVVVLPLKAVAGEDKNVVVGRQILFSASASISPDFSATNFLWDFGDGHKATGIEVSHVYNNPGIYRGQLIIEYDNRQSIDEFIVSVDKDIVLLITDSSVTESVLNELKTQAATQGILLVILQVEEQSLDYLEEAALVQKIIENREDIKQAKNILIWTSHTTGINAIIAASQELSKTASLESLGFPNKNIIVLTNNSLSVTSRIAQNIYNLIKPQSVILTNTDAKYIVSTELSFDGIINKLKDQKINYRLLGIHSQRQLTSLKPWNFLSYLINYLVNSGVPLNTIYLLLILPIIATIVAFTRQVVGINAFGIYAPSLVAVSFLATGFQYGSLLFFMVLGLGTLGRLAARKIKLMYLPRMAIVLSLVSFATLGLFLLSIIFNKIGFLSISVFPILIMVIITEKFLAAQIEQGNRAAFTLILETFILSSACYFLANWPSLRSLILGYPEVVLFTFLINYILGKWSGLRLIEYYRFRKVIQNVELSEKK